MSIALTCPQCGRTVLLPPSWAKKRKFCSQSCSAAALRVTYTCEGCGRSRTVAKADTAKRFCSDACRLRWFSHAFEGINSPHWKGGPLPYGPNWQRQRGKARKRDKYRCRRCGMHERWFGEHLSVAHIVPFKSFNGNFKKANLLSNLMSLCRRCHIIHDWENGHRT